MEIDPRKLAPRDAYRLMISCIVPRPIALVSTVSPAGVSNLAPFSFFNGISSWPPLVCFAPGRKPDGTKKDTWKNIEATGEFVINVVTEDMAAAMNRCAVDYPESVNEFEASGLTPVPSRSVRPPSVAESPVQMECTLERILEFHEPSRALVIGTVVMYRVRDDLIDDRHHVDVHRLRPLARLGGAQYARIRDVFEMPRIRYDPRLFPSRS